MKEEEGWKIRYLRERCQERRREANERAQVTLVSCSCSIVADGQRAWRAITLVMGEEPCDEEKDLRSIVYSRPVSTKQSNKKLTHIECSLTDEAIRGNGAVRSRRITLIDWELFLLEGFISSQLDHHCRHHGECVTRNIVMSLRAGQTLVGPVIIEFGAAVAARRLIGASVDLGKAHMTASEVDPRCGPSREGEEEEEKWCGGALHDGGICFRKSWETGSGLVVVTGGMTDDGDREGKVEAKSETDCRRGGEEIREGSLSLVDRPNSTTASSPHDRCPNLLSQLSESGFPRLIRPRLTDLAMSISSSAFEKTSPQKIQLSTQHIVVRAHLH